MALATQTFSKKSNEYVGEDGEIVNLISKVGLDEIVHVELPEDLVTLILLKLPVKSLISFKIVCKPCKLLIESSVFINNHLHRKIPEYFLFGLIDGEFSFSQDDDDDDDNTLSSKIDYIVGTCNGIVCFKTTNDQNPLVLYNHITKESCLLGKECSGYDVYGFCYICQTQEYKVLCFKDISEDSFDIDMRIMTLGTKAKSVRDVQNISLPAELYHSTKIANQATCGSRIFWLGEKHDDDDDDIPIVIEYDAFEDKFSTIDVPRCMERRSSSTIRSLSSCKHSLIMFDYQSDDFTSFNIWIQIKLTIGCSQQKGWSSYGRVRPVGKYIDMLPIHACWDARWILCCRNGGKFGYKGSDLFYYDRKTGKFEDEKEIDKRVVVTEFANYVQSLVSPNSICLMS